MKQKDDEFWIRVDEHNKIVNHEVFDALTGLMLTIGDRKDPYFTHEEIIQEINKAREGVRYDLLGERQEQAKDKRKKGEFSEYF